MWVGQEQLQKAEQVANIPLSALGKSPQ